MLNVTTYFSSTKWMGGKNMSVLSGFQNVTLSVCERLVEAWRQLPFWRSYIHPLQSHPPFLKTQKTNAKSFLRVNSNPPDLLSTRCPTPLTIAKLQQSVEICVLITRRHPSYGPRSLCTPGPLLQTPGPHDGRSPSPVRPLWPLLVIRITNALGLLI